MADERTDAELVVAALANREEFAALVARYDKRIRRYVVRLGSLDPDTAKDVLQETFIKAYIHLNDYDPSLPFSAWLYRIARNETITHFRRQKNRPHPAETVEDLAHLDKIADDLDIEHESNIALNRSAVRAALETLDLKYRDVLLLRFFEDKSYDEISDILELPYGTVASHLNRAKRALKEKLKRYDKHT